MSDFTQGTWILDKEEKAIVEGTPQNGTIIAYPYSQRSIKEYEANVNLILAAPDMYEVLSAIINDYTKFVVMPQDLINMVMAAFAKANGQGA